MAVLGCLKNYFEEEGILYQTTIAGALQQKGQAEHKHRHILNMPCFAFSSKLAIKFWGKHIFTIEYLINRTPSVLLDGKTPFEMLHGKTTPHSPNKNF